MTVLAWHLVTKDQDATPSPELPLDDFVRRREHTADLQVIVEERDARFPGVVPPQHDRWYRCRRVSSSWSNDSRAAAFTAAWIGFISRRRQSESRSEASQKVGVGPQRGVGLATGPFLRAARPSLACPVAARRGWLHARSGVGFGRHVRRSRIAHYQRI
jgi:hypothetical protein